MKPMTRLLNQAVLKSLEVGIDDAAELFDLDPEELHSYQVRYIDELHAKNHPVVAEPTAPQPAWWERLRGNAWFDAAFKITLALLSILICWLIPYALEKHVDPLTNTVIWIGFTAAYLLLFAGLVIEVAFWVQHPTEYEFLNPFLSSSFDYKRSLRTDLTPHERCRIVQQKYLFYLVAYCGLVLALASLTRS